MSIKLMIKRKRKKYWRQNKQKNGFTDKIWLKLIFNEKRGKIYTGYTLSAKNVQTNNNSKIIKYKWSQRGLWKKKKPTISSCSSDINFYLTSLSYIFVPIRDHILSNQIHQSEGLDSSYILRKPERNEM